MTDFNNFYFGRYFVHPSNVAPRFVYSRIANLRNATFGNINFLISPMFSELPRIFRQSSIEQTFSFSYPALRIALPISYFYAGNHYSFSWYILLQHSQNSYANGAVLISRIRFHLVILICQRFKLSFVNPHFRAYYDIVLYILNLAMIITLSQLTRCGRRRKRRKSLSPRLVGAPHKKAVCLKVYTMKPKKPNSAIRKIAKVKLSTGVKTLIYLPGQGHSLQQHSVVLIRGGRVPDSPGILYHAVRGKYDFTYKESFDRRTNRSKYGTPNPAKKI